MTLLRSRRAVNDRIDADDVDSIVSAFRWACIGSGCCLAVDAPVAGTHYRTPTVTEVILGSPLTLTVKLLEGTAPAQLAKAGHLIAPFLGGVALRVVDRGHGRAVVTVLVVDPLAALLPLGKGGGTTVTGSSRGTRAMASLDQVSGTLLIGRDEGGDNVTVAPADLPHLIIQGQTRSGKSTWLYALLVQLVRHPDVIVAGADPSGITLRPFVGTRHEPWQVLGLSHLAAVEKVLAALVAEMDGRLAAMPWDRDVLPLGPNHPLTVVVLEEYPALLRALDAADAKLGKRCRSLIARLLAESHKVGYRVVIAAQRAEASIVGAAERAQCGGRLSFRVDSLDSVKLLHSDADDLAAGHTSAPPGIALCSWPGRPLTRLRGPYIGGYGEFVAAVATACRPDPTT